VEEAFVELELRIVRRRGKRALFRIAEVYPALVFGGKKL
jgi:hypothetical protein